MHDGRYTPPSSSVTGLARELSQKLDKGQCHRLCSVTSELITWQWHSLSHLATLNEKLNDHETPSTHTHEAEDL